MPPAHPAANIPASSTAVLDFLQTCTRMTLRAPAVPHYANVQPPLAHALRRGVRPKQQPRARSRWECGGVQARLLHGARMQTPHKAISRAEVNHGNLHARQVYRMFANPA